jgi:hypothetical protein
MFLNVHKNHDTGNEYIMLGNKHNFGKRFEMICWTENMEESKSPFLSLLYDYELQGSVIIRHIPLRTFLCQFKHGISRLSTMCASNNLYQRVMYFSAQKCLDDLLEKYSNDLFLNKCASTIQNNWLEKYYNPQHDICKRRLLREHMFFIADIGAKREREKERES